MTEPVTITPWPKLHAYLSAMAATGLWGSTIDEVALELVRDGVARNLTIGSGLRDVILSALRVIDGDGVVTKSAPTSEIPPQAPDEKPESAALASETQVSKSPQPEPSPAAPAVHKNGVEAHKNDAETHKNGAETGIGVAPTTSPAPSNEAAKINMPPKPLLHPVDRRCGECENIFTCYKIDQIVCPKCVANAVRFNHLSHASRGARA